MTTFLPRFVPFFEQKIQGLFKDTFPIFQGLHSMQKKRLECMSIFSSVWQQEQLEGLSARLLLLGTWKSRLDKVSTEIQGLSSTHCNFQGLPRPWIFILKIQGLSRTFKMCANPVLPFSDYFISKC